VLFDANNRFSYRQNLAQVVATYLSDKSINVGAAGTIPAMFQAIGSSGLRDVGKGEQLPVLVQVVETFTSGGAGTLQVKLVTADNEALTSNLVIRGSTEIIALATLAAGYKFLVPSEIPPGLGDDQFIGLQYVIAGATMTAGKVTAGIVPVKQTNG
jgi:hypothetical protein